MEITSVRVKKEEREGSHMKGRASIVIDNGLAIHNIRIIEGKNGLFIAMPSKPTATGGHRDTAHPIDKETRKMFEDAIFEEYNKAE